MNNTNYNNMTVFKIIFPDLMNFLRKYNINIKYGTSKKVLLVFFNVLHFMCSLF